MRFDAQHRFTAAPEAVAAVLADPEFYLSLHLPDLSLPEVVEHQHGDDGSALVLLRYEFVGHLDPLARRLLGGERLTWTQELRIEAAASGTLRFAAEANPRLLHGDATFTLEAEGGGTVRRLEGEVVLALPGIGGMAERRIVPGVLGRLDVEAEALERRLTTAS
jgi:Protein of unknown function (DUF2505)